MKNSAIIAPIHSLKFNHGINFVKSFNHFFKDDEDLYLIFSNTNEQKMFSDLIDESLKYKSMLWTENIQYSKPITQKKYFGLREIFNSNSNIKRAATVDVDSIFIKYLDYDNAFKNSLDKKTLYATQNYQTKDIMINNSDFFSKVDKEIIKEKTENFSLYFWFNEVPLYEKNEFLTFLDYIEYDKIKSKITYNHFDHIIYVYYLLIHNKIEIKKLDISDNSSKKGSFLELQRMYSADEFSKIFTSYNPMWIKNLIKPESMTNVFMQIHRDRK